MAERKTTKQAAESAQEPQETPKVEPVYKVTQGAFERRIEAIQAAGEVRKKGFPVRLIIEKGKYKLLFSESISRATAAEAVKNLAAAGIKSEIV